MVRNVHKTAFSDHIKSTQVLAQKRKIDIEGCIIAVLVYNLITKFKAPYGHVDEALCDHRIRAYLGL